MEQTKYSESYIQRKLRGYYSGNSKYMLENMYIFRYDWESDFFVQKQNGYCYEFEIKISKSDFLADFKKKDKHIALQSKDKIRPNKFYYICPKDLITIDEVPEYAGLMHVNEFGSMIEVKPAPFLHKEKYKFEEKLAERFYHKWRTQVIENMLLKDRIKFLENKLK